MSSTAPALTRTQDMSAAELEKALCGRAKGDWHNCRACLERCAGCQYGRALVQIRLGLKKDPAIEDRKKLIIVVYETDDGPHRRITTEDDIRPNEKRVECFKYGKRYTDAPVKTIDELTPDELRKLRKARYATEALLQWRMDFAAWVADELPQAEDPEAAAVRFGFANVNSARNFCGKRGMPIGPCNTTYKNDRRPILRDWRELSADEIQKLVRSTTTIWPELTEWKKRFYIEVAGMIEQGADRDQLAQRLGYKDRGVLIGAMRRSGHPITDMPGTDWRKLKPMEIQGQMRKMRTGRGREAHLAWVQGVFRDALALLESGAEKVVTVAERLGYVNPHGMIRAMRRWGIDPGDWKKWRW
jgi:hypothetical protein